MEWSSWTGRLGPDGESLSSLDEGLSIDGARAGLETEGDGRVGGRLVLENLAAEGGLGLGALEEAALRGEILEQTRHRDTGPRLPAQALDSRS